MDQPPEAGADAQRHNIVAIGASAGGVETLVRVVQDFPADLAATVCIVLHLAPGSPSALPSILQRVSLMPCRSPVDGESLPRGEILVAPPDRHLVVTGGRVWLTAGPRESGHRPAVDALFRTAAEAPDGKVIGVVLSGTRDDGTAGLAAIKSRGGVAIVQDPGEALYSGMPASALAHVSPDAVVPSNQVAATVVRMLEASNPGHGANPGPGSEDDPVVGDAAKEPLGVRVTSTCPECGGVLQEYDGARGHAEAG